VAVAFQLDAFQNDAFQIDVSSTVWPLEADVRAGVVYGPNGNDYVGTYAGVTVSTVSGVSKYTSQGSGISYVELVVN
jgi:hypothetical protein